MRYPKDKHIPINQKVRMKFVCPEAETERLKFRLLRPDDFENWIPLFSASDIARFLGMDENMSKTELCQKWFEKVFHRYENDLGGMNVLINKNTNALIGQCGLLVQEIEGEQFLEIGYSILPKFWGMGYATEAAQKCKDIAFENGYSNELISMVHVDNIGSELVAKKNGMRLLKTVDLETANPMNVFSMKKEEWRNPNR
jgi:RimJ/RimL family protein N-acetyltransferase